MDRTKEELQLIKCIVDLFPTDVIREAEKKKIEIKSPSDYHFGVCSVCGKSDGHLNIERAHHYVCYNHKKRWHIGSNLFSDWRHETEEIWQKNHEKIKDYNEISGHEWFENLFKPEYQGNKTKASLPF